ncbi:MAG: hypothetical protein DMG65_02680 [Candidatus Angelobacter sp. Gp1-AA117]|nr:MAG: hypothetical protein DMG65_02680 [Candidatus Angelobacter sp. Gp1-AA117]
MARLLVHVEGQTEEAFVNELLRDYLISVGYESVSARIIGNARLRRRRGGIRPWPSVKKDIMNHLRQDPGCISTTMVDYYGLPQEGVGQWPGRASAALVQAGKALHVERALLDDLIHSFGHEVDSRRFIPFVVMHEFEGLLFSDCAAFARGIARSDLESDFQQIRNSFETPEDINDSPINCASRRIENLVPGYEKPLLGTLAALEIGLGQIRAHCPHFAYWIQQLESKV